MNTHPTTDLLDAYAGAPTLGLPLDSDEAEYLKLKHDDPGAICACCSRPFWHPKLNGALEKRFLESLPGLLLAVAVEEARQ